MLSLHQASCRTMYGPDGGPCFHVCVGLCCTQKGHVARGFPRIWLGKKCSNSFVRCYRRSRPRIDAEIQLLTVKLCKHQLYVARCAALRRRRLPKWLATEALSSEALHFWRMMTCSACIKHRATPCMGLMVALASMFVLGCAAHKRGMLHVAFLEYGSVESAQTRLSAATDGRDLELMLKSNFSRSNFANIGCMLPDVLRCGGAACQSGWQQRHCPVKLSTSGG